METTTQRVKLYIGRKKAIRRFTFSLSKESNTPNLVPATLKHFVRTVNEFLGKSLEPNHFIFKYQDEEGDWIHFSTELEFRECVEHHNRNHVLRMRVHVTGEDADISSNSSEDEEKVSVVGNVEELKIPQKQQQPQLQIVTAAKMKPLFRQQSFNDVAQCMCYYLH